MITWHQYKGFFEKAATEDGLSNQEVAECLAYAGPIFEQGLPIIYNLQHFARLVGYKTWFVEGAIGSSPKFYRHFTISKKSGGRRQISEPLPSLKEIQRWILDEILSVCECSRFAKAYIPGRSTRDNARFHQRQPLVLSLDIEDFFGSISKYRVWRVFRRLGYSPSVSGVLAGVCSLEGKLPQGAPTSPMLSNLVMRRCDNRISGYCVKHHIRYTRYADDLTFSGEFSTGTLIRFVEMVLREEGFRLNQKKTRTRQRHERQEVTGIVVNERMQVPREVRRSFRQAVYYIEKYGLAGHIDHIGENRANYLQHLIGVGNQILFVDPKNEDTRRKLAVLRSFLHSYDV